MPRFVVLSHDWPEPHFDLLIERDSVLKAWRLPANFNPDVPTIADANVDHRLHYLDYEGPVGDERGRVIRWDAGEAEWVFVNDKRIVVRLDGSRFGGLFEFVHQDRAIWDFRPCLASVPTADDL